MNRIIKAYMNGNPRKAAARHTMERHGRGLTLKLSAVKYSTEIPRLRLADGEAERWRQRVMAPYFFQFPAECCAPRCCPWRQPRDLELINPKATRTALQCTVA